VLGPRFNPSEYLSMRVEDPVNMRGGLNFGPALILNQNPIFEIASKLDVSTFRKGCFNNIFSKPIPLGRQPRQAGKP